MHRDICISRQRGQFECGLAAWIAGDDGIVPVSGADQGEIDRCNDQESRADLRQEAKEYIVQDGDIMHILANR